MVLHGPGLSILDIMPAMLAILRKAAISLSSNLHCEAIAACYMACQKKFPMKIKSLKLFTTNCVTKIIMLALVSPNHSPSNALHSIKFDRLLANLVTTKM